jgi:molybdopterin converting factor small subunit
MKVNLLFFGATADEVGKREMELCLNENTTASQALSRIVEQVPRLADHKLIYSVNMSYVPGEQVLHDGDELAIFTAVSGG